MALGSTYNNNNDRNQNRGVTVYSNYRMNNPDSKIDATCLTFRFWSSSLCVGIFPRKNTGNDEIKFDMDNGITIYLSHSKALILKCELENFLKDPITYSGRGVGSGKAAIIISNGVEYGKNTPVLTIYSVSDNGDIVSSFAYEFKTNYNSISAKDGKFEDIFGDYKDIEIRQFITLLDEYVKSSTKASAFFTIDQMKYTYSFTESKIDAIASNLGVEVNRGSGQRKSNESYFNRNRYNNNSSSTVSDYAPSDDVAYGYGTMDDLE